MKSSVNQPWSIGEKQISRYGKTWANLDFIISTMNKKQFKEDPYNTNVGTLKVSNRNINMMYKHLIAQSSNISQLANAVYMNDFDKEQKYEIMVSGEVFLLRKHEITKLDETLRDALDTIKKQYHLNIW